jgi:hypothetical protein
VRHIWHWCLSKKAVYARDVCCSLGHDEPLRPRTTYLSVCCQQDCVDTPRGQQQQQCCNFEKYQVV